MVVRRATPVLCTTSFRQICPLRFRLLVSDDLVHFAGGFSCFRNDVSVFVFSRCVCCSFFVPVLLWFHFGFFHGPTQSGFGSFLLVCCGSVGHGFGGESRWMW